MKVLKKMSIRDLNGFVKGDLKAMAEGASGEVYVCRIFGSARSVKTGTSTYGDFLEFTGDFQAVDIKGVPCVSAKCFLPSPGDDMLAQALKAEGVNAVDFAYDIFVIADTTEVGFQYRIHSLLEHKPSEPLKALSSALPPLRVAATPQLAAPAETPAETPAEPQAEAVTKGKATK